MRTIIEMNFVLVPCTHLSSLTQLLIAALHFHLLRCKCGFFLCVYFSRVRFFPFHSFVVCVFYEQRQRSNWFCLATSNFHLTICTPLTIPICSFYVLFQYFILVIYSYFLSIYLWCLSAASATTLCGILFYYIWIGLYFFLLYPCIVQGEKTHTKKK